MFNIVLGTLEVLALASCFYGFHCIYLESVSVMALVYNSLWFIFGIASNFLALLSIMYSYLEEKDEMTTKAHWCLQHHYLFAWLTVIVGYPTLITSIWNIYYPTAYAHIFVFMALIPLATWLLRLNKIIILSTQLVTMIGILGQGYLCYLVGNMFGVCGALVMVVNIISLSVPISYNFIGINSRVTFIVGLGTCSFLFAKTVELMGSKP